MSSYPDLLFHHPDLVVCWHAATSSEKLFKKQYNSFKIKKMNVPTICDKILEIVTRPPRKETTNKCSLYLFSQLMCGITKLHKYQVEYYQKEVSELEEKIHPPSRSEIRELTIREYEEPPEIQLSTSQDSPHIISDMHTFQDEDHDNIIRRMIDMNLAAQQDFGVLTDEQLIYMLDHINGEVPLDRTTEQVMDRLEETSVADMTVADVVISEEIRQERQQSQEFRSPELLSKSRGRSRTELTPQKRQSQIQVETPTKRKRLTFDREIAKETAADPSEAVPTELPMEVEPPSALILSEQEMQQPDVNMELESLHAVSIQPTKSKKKPKMVDKTNRLNDEKWLYTQWRENPNIHCKDLNIPSSRHLITPMKLLRQPATELFTRWGRDLRQLFSERAKPCAFPSRDKEDRVPPQQVMRAEETTTIFATEELSTLGKTQTAVITADSTTGLHSVSNIPSMNINLTNLNIIPETRETITSTSEIPLDMINLGENINITEDEQNQQIITANNIETETSLEDIDKLLRRQSPLKIITSLSLSSLQSSLTIDDILVILQDLWRKQSHVLFSDLISRDKCSKEDVATIFEMLLELHKQKKAILLQKCCYDTLYIKNPKA